MPVGNVHEARTTLSHLILAAEREQAAVIARNGIEVVRLVPGYPALPREAGS
jgi:antitoxin (DNA-binding transcriptional repressor) of toxin-antitoxin stability system